MTKILNPSAGLLAFCVASSLVIILLLVLGKVPPETAKTAVELLVEVSKLLLPAVKALG